ncbi:MAG: ATP-dependent DNA ligase [Candidatus Aenigmarchaeota archaeon]|nr:ATP-dependent DNA ligase [Candidatus Aenigmarchaeota archaeon]
MEYSTLADRYEKLEAVASKLAKADIIGEFLKSIPSYELPKIVLLLQGRVYPSYSENELGIATQMMIKSISKASGFSAAKVEEIFKRTGDLGLTAEQCVKSKRQASLLKKKLTTDNVFENLQKLATIAGQGSQDKKFSLIAELIISAQPKEARYIVRTVLGELRIGAAEGIIRDAIVKAFLADEKSSKEEKEKATEAVENAWSLLNDYGEVAKIANEKGIKGLQKVGIQLGKPIQVMLGLAAEKIEDVVKEFGEIIAEYKYDGMRVVVEKKGNHFWLFTRRQEDVTKQFPDIVELAKKCLKADECIVEGEVLGIDTKTGYPLPFQAMSQRVHRKYDIDRLVKEIPVQVNLFDVMYVNGTPLFNEPLIERRKELARILKPIKGKFQLAKHIITGDVKKLEQFYGDAVEGKQEGLMLKVPNAPYVFGRHVGTMYKIKPVMENLDLVIIGAIWGEGGRTKWLTSYELACRDPNTGKFLSCGMMSTGLNEDEYELMTKELKKIIISENGKIVIVKPKIVLEVGYQEIQKSPNYESGFGLRFPRFVRVRDDKGPDEADTITRVKKLYSSQGKAG